ncbi:MAG: inovirus Gp2 family protein [Providencia heimbachae]|nr:inovirus Gp2 family protein [Providencia heimbachae]
MSTKEYNSYYQDYITETLDCALKAYPRITVIRVDLHFPVMDEYGDMPTCFPNTEGSPISRFIDSLNAKLKHDQHRKTRQGKRIYPNRLRYLWVRELVTAAHPHYHCVLIFNKDAYYHLGDHDLSERSLRTMITSAWYSALQLELDPITDTGPLVHYPENCRYCLNREALSFTDDYNVVMGRLNYLAKEYSKHYSADHHSIGHSQY